MATEAKTLILINIKSDFKHPLAKKVSGDKEETLFKKGEAFEVSATVKRKDAKGKDIQVSTLELFQKLFPGSIQNTADVVSVASVADTLDENAALKDKVAKLEAENATLKANQK